MAENDKLLINCNNLENIIEKNKSDQKNNVDNLNVNLINLENKFQDVSKTLYYIENLNNQYQGDIK